MGYNLVVSNQVTSKQITELDFQTAKKSVRDTFENWVVRSIEITFQATSNSERDGQGGTPLAAFLLLSCAIDAIAGFYAGRIKTYGTGKQYKSFVAKYMRAYSPENMYDKLRCGLAHNFATGKGLALTHGRPDAHNVRDVEGITIKNFEQVFVAFKAGLEQYFSDLERSDDLRGKFMRRLNAFGLVSRGTLTFARKGTAGLDLTGVPATAVFFDPGDLLRNH